jgi:hypothetical protein
MKSPASAILQRHAAQAHKVNLFGEVKQATFTADCETAQWLRLGRPHGPQCRIPPWAGPTPETAGNSAGRAMPPDDIVQ